MNINVCKKCYPHIDYIKFTERSEWLRGYLVVCGQNQRTYETYNSPDKPNYSTTNYCHAIAINDELKKQIKNRLKNLIESRVEIEPRFTPEEIDELIGDMIAKIEVNENTCPYYAEHLVYDLNKEFVS